MNTTTIDRLREQLESRRTEIQGDLDQMAGELEELGVDQGLEGGTLGNHLADDGSNVMEAERLTDRRRGPARNTRPDQRGAAAHGERRLRHLPALRQADQ